MLNRPFFVRIAECVCEEVWVCACVVCSYVLVAGDIKEVTSLPILISLGFAVTACICEMWSGMLHHRVIRFFFMCRDTCTHRLTYWIAVGWCCTGPCPRLCLMMSNCSDYSERTACFCCLPCQHHLISSHTHWLKKTCYMSHCNPKPLISHPAHTPKCNLLETVTCCAMFWVQCS